MSVGFLVLALMCFPVLHFNSDSPFRSLGNAQTLIQTNLSLRLSLILGSVWTLSTRLESFSLDWNRWDRVYIFPPIRLIPRVLSHLESFQGQAVVVAPWWPGQAWFLTLQSKSQFSFRLPNPQLSQEINGESFSCSSRILLQLACWTF